MGAKSRYHMSLNTCDRMLHFVCLADWKGSDPCCSTNYCIHSWSLSRLGEKQIPKPRPWGFWTWQAQFSTLPGNIQTCPLVSLPLYNNSIAFSFQYRGRITVLGLPTDEHVISTGKKNFGSKAWRATGVWSHSNTHSQVTWFYSIKSQSITYWNRGENTHAHTHNIVAKHGFLHPCMFKIMICLMQV